MKEISLKQKREESKGIPVESPKEYYPSFTMHDHHLPDLMKIPIGKEVLAKLKKTSHEMHEGDRNVMACGFDVMSIMVKDEETMKKAMEEVKMPENHKASALKKYNG